MPRVYACLMELDGARVPASSDGTGSGISSMDGDSLRNELTELGKLLPSASRHSPTAVTWEGSPYRQAAFDVQRAADVSVAAAVSAAAGLARVRDRIAPSLAFDHTQTLAAFSGHLTVDGMALPKWADLSGMYATGDDRVLQLHCNFPHHAAGVIDHLGLGGSDAMPDREALAAEISQRSSFVLEQELIERGMIAAVCRTLDEWSEHPHCQATRDLPLLTVEQIGDADPRPLATDENEYEGRPAAGVRVVDASRVLAGPVAGQTLAGFGADVLRVGAAHLPAVEFGVLSTGFGKRNAHVDLDTDVGRTTMRSLLGDGTVLIDAYRPGALASRGFSPQHVAEFAPGSVIVQLCAFDWIGPWAGRRGFDSIVQSTTGIALAGGEAAGVAGPLPLPVQALDYATGFLAAFAALELVRHQQEAGGTWLARLSLLRTRNWLVGAERPAPFEPAPLPELSRWVHSVDSSFGRIEAPASVGGFWDLPPAPLGSSAPVWR